VSFSHLIPVGILIYVLNLVFSTLNPSPKSVFFRTLRSPCLSPCPFATSSSKEMPSGHNSSPVLLVASGPLGMAVDEVEISPLSVVCLHSLFTLHPDSHSRPPCLYPQCFPQQRFCPRRLSQHSEHVSVPPFFNPCTFYIQSQKILLTKSPSCCCPIVYRDVPDSFRISRLFCTGKLPDPASLPFIVCKSSPPPGP